MHDHRRRGSMRSTRGREPLTSARRVEDAASPPVIARYPFAPNRVVVGPAAGAVKG
jgi:hypothetical protein